MSGFLEYQFSQLDQNLPYLICRHEEKKKNPLIYLCIELADLQFKVSSGWFVSEWWWCSISGVSGENCRALQSWQLKPLTLTPSAGLCTTVVCGS